MARTRAPAHRVDLAPLVTQRLLLRSFQRGDLVAVERLASDPRVREHAPLESRAVDVARDADSTPAMQRFARASRRKHADEIRAVVVRRTGKLIGACDITRLSRREADIGYMLARRHWGHGYATELVEAVLTHAFSTLGLSRVTAVVAIDNERSRHVLAKNGFQWQELIRSYLRSGRRSWDCHRYAIDLPRWQHRATARSRISHRPGP